MLRRTRTTVLVFAASYALVALLASAAQATVWPLSTAYSRGSVMYSTANWNALKATIEVLNPSLSSADYTNGGYLRERIKVNRNNQNADIRLGYSKEKWYGVSTYLSAYFEYTLTDNSFSHAALDNSISVGSSYEFLWRYNGQYWIPYVSGGQGRVGSLYVTLGVMPWSSTNQFSAGSMTNASSAVIGGGSGDAANVNISMMRKSSDGGLNYSIGPDDGYVNSDPGSDPEVHGDWDSPASTSHNRRSNN